MTRAVAIIRKELRAVADERKARLLSGFFKTAEGEYGHGDRFLGVMVPQARAVARRHRDLPMSGIRTLLASPWHEERFTALVILADRFARGDEAERGRVVRFYHANARRVDNWDLVDVSAPRILGVWLRTHDATVLDRLARSRHLWERRIAIVSTLALIVEGRLDDTFRVADLLMDDPHDLIHKATGWMLREAGKRDRRALERWLRPRQRRMPRTMLRYAIERLPERRRKAYLAGTA